MKKIFLITAILALGAASFAGCGAGANVKPTTEESTTDRARITAGDTENNTESPGAPEKDSKCPDGKCPDGKCNDKKHRGEIQPRESRARRDWDYFFYAPELRGDIGPEKDGYEQSYGLNEEKSETKPENKGKRRDKRPPLTRIPKPYTQIEPNN